MENIYITHNAKTGSEKPNFYKDKENRCPFCERHNVLPESVLDEDGPIFLIKNRYPVIPETDPTVLIENDTCKDQFHTYKKEHLEQLFLFADKNWKKYLNGDYQSVMFLKNYGPYSGGSVLHPHMQIIGYKKTNIEKNIKDEDFEGILVEEKEGVALNLSTKPRTEFYEFNVIGKSITEEKFRTYVQIATKFILEKINKRYESYNIFFYKRKEKTVAKIISRGPGSPFLAGYLVSQLPNNLEEVANDLKEYIETKS